MASLSEEQSRKRKKSRIHVGSGCCSSQKKIYPAPTLWMSLNQFGACRGASSYTLEKAPYYSVVEFLTGTSKERLHSFLNTIQSWIRIKFTKKTKVEWIISKRTYLENGFPRQGERSQPLPELMWRKLISPSKLQVETTIDSTWQFKRTGFP